MNPDIPPVLPPDLPPQRDLLWEKKLAQFQREREEGPPPKPIQKSIHRVFGLLILLTILFGLLGYVAEGFRDFFSILVLIEVGMMIYLSVKAQS